MPYRITYTSIGDLQLLMPATFACPQVPPPPTSGVEPGGPSIPERDASYGLAPEEPDRDEEADQP